MTKPNLALNTTTPEAPVPTIHYELTNHLGNVMAVITDEPTATETPAVESLADYYPFGMTMPGRSYNAHIYRYGFTGHEKESDLSEGIYTTQYRLYDARVGRWLSVDPLFEKYVGMSPYNY
jgi:RHS repeat-associated protein